MRIRIGSASAKRAGLTLACLTTMAIWLMSAGAGMARYSDSVERAAQDQKTAGAAAELTSRDGQKVGRARLTDTPNGVLLTVNLTGAPAGEHAFHIHQVGRCDAPTFESAGGHLNPTGAQHGFLNAKGPHLGDLPNIHVPSSGQLTFEYLASDVLLRTGDRRLLDEDGAALVMHVKPDDYRTDPAGAAGDRVACGVIGAR